MCFQILFTSSHIKHFVFIYFFLCKGEIASTSNFAHSIIQENTKVKEPGSDRIIITEMNFYRELIVSNVVPRVFHTFTHFTVTLVLQIIHMR